MPEWPLTDGRLPYPMQQRNTLRVTSKGTHEKGATEQCGLTALSLEQAPTKLPISASKQSIMHVRLVWERQSSQCVRLA